MEAADIFGIARADLGRLGIRIEIEFCQGALGNAGGGPIGAAMFAGGGGIFEEFRAIPGARIMRLAGFIAAHGPGSELPGLLESVARILVKRFELFFIHRVEEVEAPIIFGGVALAEPVLAVAKLLRRRMLACEIATGMVANPCF